MSASGLPQNMKAVVLETTTGTLKLVTQPVPTPPENEHLIKVHTTAITNGELTWRHFIKWPEHQVVTYDVTGTILNSVPGSRFQIGDEVYGRVNAFRPGTAREYATILPSEAALRPTSLSLEEAATVPMSAETAWQALFVQAGLKELDIDGAAKSAQGKRVLITGASGAVGLFGVQFAKLAGAYVVGTCSGANVDFVLGLGADEAVDYRSKSMRDWVGDDESKKFDVVFECVGGKSLEDAWYAVKEGGVLVNVTPDFKEPEGGAPKGVKGWFFVMDSNGDQLQHISKLIENGKARTIYDSVWSFEDYQKAFDHAHSGKARGKVILRP